MSGLAPSNFVYKYDTAANSWIQLHNFTGSNRQNHKCFTLNGYGYMFGGFDGFNTLNEMWEYNPTTDTWVQKASPPLPSSGPGRNGPAVLVINNQVYVGLGGTANGSNAFSDFYLFDPGTIGVAGSGSYTPVAPMPVGRECPAMFTIGDTGYIGIGYEGGTGYLDDFWKYDPTTNVWTQLCNFNGGARQHPFSASVNGVPYVGCGDNASGNNKDNWTWVTCTLKVNLGNDTAICSGETVTLRDTFSNSSSLWSTGDTTSSITVSGGGSYWLQVTQQNCSTCIGRDTINVSITGPPPAFSLGNDTTYCGSFSRVLSTGNANTLWSTGITGPSITVTTPGTFWASITNSCGTASDTIVIHQNPMPIVNLGSDTNICNNNPLTLDATTPNATYTWQDGSTSSTLTVSSSGTYWVAVDINGCEARDSITISYINLNSFSIGDDTVYCGSFSRILTAGVAHTIWSTSDTATYITVTLPGLYWGVAFVCNDTLRDSINLSQKPLPVVNLGSDTSICQGTTLTLDAAHDSASFLWQNGTTDSIFTASAGGLYWVDVTVDGCTKRDSIRISNLSPPSPFSIGNDTTICQDSSITLSAYQLQTSYFWSNGDTTPFIIVSQSGSYQVIDSNACGSYTTSVTVTTRECSCKIDIPTAFSPNNDGRNDFYHILTQCPLRNFQFDIYDRWGQRLFSTNNLMDKWDGTYRGVPQPLGVYVYYLKYTDPYSNTVHNQAGNVTLVR